MKTPKFFLKTWLIAAVCIAVTFLANAQSAIQPALGPQGGHAASLAKFGTSVFAGGFNSGLWKTTDNGNSWQKVNLPGNNYLYTPWIFTNDSLIFVAGSDSTTNFLSKSSDGGITWNRINAAGVSSMIQLSNFLLACRGYGLGDTISISDLSGENWTDIGAFPGNVAPSTLFADGDTVYAGTWSSGIYKSYNYGTTWVPCNNGFDSVPVYHFLKYHNQIFASTDEDAVIVSSDCGQSWRLIPDNGLGCPNVSCLNVYNDNLFGYGLNLASYDSVNNVWVPTVQDLYTYGVNAILEQSGNLWCATTEGIFISPDGGSTWNWSGNGITGCAMEDICSNGQSLLATVQLTGAYISNDSGSTWQETIPSPEFQLVTRKTAYYSNDTMIIAGRVGSSESLFFSTSGGTSWTNISLNLPTASNFNFIVKGGRIVASITLTNGNSNTYYTDDLGSTWNQATGLPTVPFICLLDGGSRLFYSSTQGLYISADNGATWSINNFLLGPLSYINGATSYNSITYFATDSGIVISSDNGTTWTEFAPNQLTSLSRYFDIHEVNGNIYTISGNYLYQLNIAGDSIIKIAAAPAFLNLSSFTAQGNKLFFNTPGASVWYFDLQNQSLGIRPVQEASSFSVFPNPSAGTYYVTGSSEINKIEVYSAIGERVLTINNNLSKKAEINLSFAGPGTYYAKIYSNGLVETQVIVKIE